jgi:hypothetical protein
MNHTLELLEDRRLMSTTAPSPSLAIGPIIVGPGPVVLASPGKGVAVHAEATDEFTAKIARLPGHTAKHLSELSGSIDWGDGSDESTATFTRATDGTISVLGTHTYANTGKFNVSVTIIRRPYAEPGKPVPQFVVLLGTVKTTATVTPDDDGGVSIVEGANHKFTAKVGSFDFRPLDIVIDHTTIDWGDGTTSNGNAVQTGAIFSGEYNVFGTHTYAKTGIYKVHVVVHTRLAGSKLVSGTAADFFSKITVVELDPVV